MKSLEALAFGKSEIGDDDDESKWAQKEAPPWFDQHKFDRGIAFFRKHMTSVLFSYMLSLIAGFNLDVFLQTLLFTGQSSSPEVSGKRYFATLLYILQWYDTDITDPASKGYKSLMKVRRIHHHVRLALKKRQKEILLTIVNHENPDNEAIGLLEEGLEDEGRGREKTDEDDEDDFVYIDLQRPKDASASVDGSEFRVAESSSQNARIVKDDANSKHINVDEKQEEVDEEAKLYLNQYDMALVQSAFVAGIVLYPDWIGINDHREAFEDYIYTWRVFGWFLGIQDQYNICEGGFDEVFASVEEVKDFELVPAIKKKSLDADKIIRAFIDGAHKRFQRQDASVSTFLSPAALISISQRPFYLPQEFEPPDLTYFDQFCITLLKLFFSVIYYVSPFRNLVNSVLSLPNVMRLIA